MEYIINFEIIFIILDDRMKVLRRKKEEIGTA
jgi:hypothetical protein